MKKTIVVSLLGIVAVIIAIAYLVMGDDGLLAKPKAENLVDVPGNAIPAKKVLAGPSSGTSSLQELLARAEALECSVSYQRAVAIEGDGMVNEKPVTGNYFTSNGMMRGDFILPEALDNSVTSIILRENTMYNWSVIEGEKYGVKYDLSTLAESESIGKAPEVTGPVPFDQPVAYECKPWENVDGSIFTIPTDILFKDVANMKNINMEYGNTYEQTGVSAQCELCQKVARGPGQDECKVAFKCQ